MSTVDDIKKRYSGIITLDFNTYAENLIQELESIDKMGNSSAYRRASLALIRFMGKESISFEKIDLRFSNFPLKLRGKPRGILLINHSETFLILWQKALSIIQTYSD